MSHDAIRSDAETPIALPSRRGHFQLESGHHGNLWLDLELLCLRPERVAPAAARLGRLLAEHGAEVVCGPLVEGAFVALMVAQQRGLPFSYSEPRPARTAGLFPVRYRIPAALRPELRGRRVAVVNDVINAGSAVLGTLEDLRACQARPVAIGALAVLGSAASALAATNELPLVALHELPNSIWTPHECPLCAAGTPLSNAGPEAEEPFLDLLGARVEPPR